MNLNRDPANNNKGQHLNFKSEKMNNMNSDIDKIRSYL